MIPAMTLCGISAKEYRVTSPDGQLSAIVETGGKLTYEVQLEGHTVISPSAIGMELSNGVKLGEKPKVSGVKRNSVDEMVPSPFYRAESIRDNYNELAMNIGKGWTLVFRAFNDAVAYRFVCKDKKPFEIIDETVEYRFPADFTATAPYVRSGTSGDFESQFMNSFENTYTVAPVSQLDNGRLVFLPMAVETPEGVTVAMTEAALENYPGLYLNNTGMGTGMKGVFAKRPKTMEQGGHNRLQMVVKDRENFIAKVEGPRSFPWRVAVVTKNDKDLAASNISYLLSDPSRVPDTSWIKPGKVAWEWWNDWNLEGVDFKTGVNNETYKAYIDFAAEKGIEYVILDEGWAVNLQADLMQVVDNINLPELVDYAAKKGVGLILWAGYYAFDRDMENVCRHYADMGIKGFKVDFMDRDDQIMTDFNYRAAETAARHHLVLDLHGTHKPAGMNRTWPNVLNFEGVNGLEQLKWAQEKDVDQIKNDVTIPFLRQLAGPMDYTQGAMLNGVPGSYRPSNSEPMSQGTRCRQLALYMIFDSPLNMLCDSPSNYRREPECTGFIAEVPTTWDETRVLDASMGEYIVTARRKGNSWYVGGITDRTPRDIKVDLSFLAPGSHKAVIFRDGVNAHRKGSDYKRVEKDVNADMVLDMHLAPGGGFAIRID